MQLWEYINHASDHVSNLICHSHKDVCRCSEAQLQVSDKLIKIRKTRSNIIFLDCEKHYFKILAPQFGTDHRCFP